MNIKRIIGAGAVVWVVSTAWGWLTCGWLFNWVYQIPPIIWKAPEAMMTPGNTAYSLIVGLIGAILFVLVFAVLYSGIPGTGVKKGLIYGFLMWLVGTVAGIGTLPAYMTIASAVVVYWIIGFLVVGLIKGAIVGAMYKK